MAGRTQREYWKRFQKSPLTLDVDASRHSFGADE